MKALITTLVTALLLVAGCAGAGSGDGGRSTVTVSAAASLTEAFTELGRTFERAHPKTRVVFDFGPSSGLAARIGQGAPVDVYASADPASMDKAVASGRMADRKTLAHNEIALVAPAGQSPGPVQAIADLSRPGVRLALCQPAVPCGVAARDVLSRSNVRIGAVSEETDVKAVLTKVTHGSVDAGFVYRTDARAAGTAVRALPLPDGISYRTEYRIAALRDARDPALAEAFVDYVLSAEGRQVLARTGFEAP